MYVVGTLLDCSSRQDYRDLDRAAPESDSHRVAWSGCVCAVKLQCQSASVERASTCLCVGAYSCGLATCQHRSALLGSCVSWQTGMYMYLCICTYMYTCKLLLSLVGKHLCSLLDLARDWSIAGSCVTASSRWSSPRSSSCSFCI